MADETLLTSTRRLVQSLNIDLNKGGFITEDTEKALDACARQMNIAMKHAQETKTDLFTPELGGQKWAK